MTKEEYDVALAASKAKRKQLLDELYQLDMNETQYETKYVQSCCPFKVGDLVLCNGTDKVFITDITPLNSRCRFQHLIHNDFGYKMVKCKKDGTPSRTGPGFYNIQSLSLITSSPSGNNASA